MDWNILINNTLDDYYAISNFDVSSFYNTEILDVSETISELSYLTHDYFRYYGKFPSKVAKSIIEYLVKIKAINNKHDIIFDNYNGSGTSLVESKIMGFDSAGVDINPFAVLASNVKTRNLNVEVLNSIFFEFKENIYDAINATFPQEDLMLFDTILNQETKVGIEEVYRKVMIDFSDINKWFDDDVVKELSIIKYFLLKMEPGFYKEFFLLGFFSIIRRVSKAHDAEIRPHVNPKKRKRSAIEAFEKKIGEMIATMNSWNSVTSTNVNSVAFNCSNSDTEAMTNYINCVKNQYQKDLGAVISHPPYLNCFDYIPVYRLKFLWAVGFDEIYGKHSIQELKSKEIKSYPATKDSFINNYFLHNQTAYRIIYDTLKPNGYCCVVIGDCTIQKKVFSVHKVFIKMMEDIGFTVDKVVYRTTAYGTGRYAYKHKAEYNDSEEGKKDAIIFFKK